MRKAADILPGLKTGSSDGPARRLISSLTVSLFQATTPYGLPRILESVNQKGRAANGQDDDKNASHHYAPERLQLKLCGESLRRMARNTSNRPMKISSIEPG